MRLLNGRQYEHVRAHGKRGQARGLYVWVAPNNLGHVRMGLVVSRKVHKRSTRRNRLRRQLREIIRSTVELRSASIDITISPRTEALEMSYGQLSEQLLRAISIAIAALARNHKD